MTRIWFAGLLMAASLVARADDSTFWRVRAVNTAIVATIDMDGMLTWSNSVPGNNEQVQRATILSPVADWQDYALVPATGTVTSMQAFNLHPPANMVLIPAGSFMMGNATNVFPEDEGIYIELPQHTVYVSAFFMERDEVTKALWGEVYQWATNSGYTFDNQGSWKGGTNYSKGPNHPVHTVNWYDCVKWCNARSARDGLTPCYTTNGNTYRTGNNSNVVCNWSVDGYRLPTEAEWEKAARGGVADTRFPWTDYSNNISHAKANYYAYPAGHSYDVNPLQGNHPAYTNGDAPYTSPVGSFAPNGYGLYDMAGNVYEWVWDLYSSSYYSSSPGADPKGPATGGFRMLRGGCWLSEARCALRLGDHAPIFKDYYAGFRCARGL